MSTRPNIPLGVYQHHKGGMYRLLHLARHEATLQWLCVYTSVLSLDGTVWVRTTVDWNFKVNGKDRFTFIEP